MAPAATIAGTLSPAGEPLQRLPPADARPCTCLEPIRLTASSTPGQTLPKLLCSRERHAGDGGADAKAAIGGLLDCHHLGDFLDVDDHAGLQHAGSHLHQQDPCRRPGCARRCRLSQMRRSLRQAYQAPDIGVPSWSSAISLFVCPPHMGDGLILARQCDKPTRREAVGTACEIRLIRQAPMRAAGLARPDCSEAEAVAVSKGALCAVPTILIRTGWIALTMAGHAFAIWPAGLELASDSRIAVTSMPLFRFLVAAAASLSLSSLAIAQPAPGSGPARTGTAGASQPAARSAAAGRRSARAPCGGLSQRHVVRPLPRRPQAAGAWRKACRSAR